MNIDRITDPQEIKIIMSLFTSKSIGISSSSPHPSYMRANLSLTPYIPKDDIHDSRFVNTTTYIIIDYIIHGGNTIHREYYRKEDSSNILKISKIYDAIKKRVNKIITITNYFIVLDKEEYLSLDEKIQKYTNICREYKKKIDSLELSTDTLSTMIQYKNEYTNTLEYLKKIITKRKKELDSIERELEVDLFDVPSTIDNILDSI